MKRRANQLNRFGSSILYLYTAHHRPRPVGGCLEWFPRLAMLASAQSGSSAPLSVAMGLVEPRQQQRVVRKKLKGCHVVPQDDWDSLQEPLRSDFSVVESEADGENQQWQRRSKREVLASSRVERDQLMRKMEELILKEAELASAYELFDYTRQKCVHEHDEIVARLERYEQLLREVQVRAAEIHSADIEQLFTTDEERGKWRHTKEMVHSILPELIGRVEENIDINSVKIRRIQELMEEVRAERLAVREEIATKEDDIALALE